MKSKQPESRVINEVYAPKFGESLVNIFRITGKNTDFSKYPSNENKVRYFKDEKGVFREMKDKLKKDKKIIAE